jgi:hypothetical protein
MLTTVDTSGPENKYGSVASKSANQDQNIRVRSKFGSGELDGEVDLDS